MNQNMLSIARRSIIVVVVLFCYASNAYDANPLGGTGLLWGHPSDAATLQWPTISNWLGNSCLSLDGDSGWNVALRGDGKIVAWGSSTYLQSPAPADVTNDVWQVTAGWRIGAVIKSNNTIWSWGQIIHNADGHWQTNLAGATLPGGCRMVSCGDKHIAMLSSNTQVYWIAPTNADAGFADEDNMIPLTNVVAIDSGWYHLACLKEDGTVSTVVAAGVGTVPPAVTNISSIRCGPFHTVALRSNGTVIAWGDDSYGQTTGPSNYSGAMAIGATRRNTYVLLSNKTLVCWGDNAVSQTNIPANATNISFMGGGHYSMTVIYNVEGEEPPPDPEPEPETNIVQAIPGISRKIIFR